MGASVMQSGLGESPSPRRDWRRWPAWAGVLLALLGWWLSCDLFRMQYGGQASNPLLARACSAQAGTPGMDCGSVLASAWGSVPISPKPGAPRLPLSAFGMGYFAFVGLWFLLIGPPTRDRAVWCSILVATLAIGLLVSVRYTLVMRDELGVWCPGCLAVHGVNGLLVLAGLLTLPWRAAAAPAAVLSHPRGSLVMATFLAGGLAFLLHLSIAFIAVQNQAVTAWSKNYQEIADDPAYMRWNYERQPRFEIPLDGRLVLGPPDAPLTLVMFGDLQCAKCRKAHALLAELQASHPQRMRVAFLHFPLDQACNPDLPRSLHPQACAAAEASEAVLASGGLPAWQRWTELVFANQGRISAMALADWAAAAGVERSVFEAALASDAARLRVESDVALAGRMGVRHTPVVFLNGRRLDAWEKSKQWFAWVTGDADSQPAGLPQP